LKKSYLKTVVEAGNDRPSLSRSKLMKRSSLSRLLDASLVWQQYVDDATPTPHAETTVINVLLGRVATLPRRHLVNTIEP